MEGSRTNLVPNSSNLDTASWSIVNAVKSASSIPGFINLTSNGGDFPRVVRNQNFAAGEYAFSFLVSKNTSSHAHITIERLPLHTLRFYVSLITGEIRTSNYVKDGILFTSVRSEVIRISENLFQINVSFVQAEPTAGSSTGFFIGPSDNFSSTPSSICSIDVGRIQIESGLSATSHIVTGLSEVSRAADSYTIPLGMDMEECTVAMWYSAGLGNNRNLFSLGHTSSEAEIIHEVTGTDNLRTYIQDAQGNYEILGLANKLNSNKNQVAILGVKQGQQFAYSKGLNFNQDSDSLSKIKIFNKLTIGQRTSGVFSLNGRVHKVAVFPRLLNQNEMQSLASL